VASFYGDADNAFALEDIGVTVSAGGVVAFGALDLEDKLVIQDPGGRGEIVAQVPSVVVQVSAFPAAALAIDAAITVDGADYVIRGHEAASVDGALKKLYLRKAS